MHDITDRTREKFRPSSDNASVTGSRNRRVDGSRLLLEGACCAPVIGVAPAAALCTAADLFFADFEILEVDEEGVMLEKRRGKGMTMDCFRKAWLLNPVKGQFENRPAAAGPGSGAEGSALLGRQGARWRRCARCAAVMEDVLTQRQALQWLVMQQRRCFCSGFWDTLLPGELVA